MVSYISRSMATTSNMVCFAYSTCASMVSLFPQQRWSCWTLQFCCLLTVAPFMSAKEQNIVPAPLWIWTKKITRGYRLKSRARRRLCRPLVVARAAAPGPVWRWALTVNDIRCAGGWRGRRVFRRRLLTGSKIFSPRSDEAIWSCPISIPYGMAQNMTPTTAIANWNWRRRRIRTHCLRMGSRRLLLLLLLLLCSVGRTTTATAAAETILGVLSFSPLSEGWPSRILSRRMTAALVSTMLSLSWSLLSSRCSKRGQSGSCCSCTGNRKFVLAVVSSGGYYEESLLQLLSFIGFGKLASRRGDELNLSPICIYVCR